LEEISSEEGIATQMKRKLKLMATLHEILLENVEKAQER
jgi:hypothetical protein